MDGTYEKKGLSLEVLEGSLGCFVQLVCPYVAAIQDDWSDACFPDVGHKVWPESKPFVNITPCSE